MSVLLVIALLLGVANHRNAHANPWRPSIGPPRAPGRPVDVMTDVINDLGVKLLDCYVDHPGNVAFSPTGLAFVLAALYEGSAGRTSRQIAHVLDLPRDRRVTEIGLRDIHRRLRSYLNADAFLGGLTLNRDDIILRPEFEDTLRFYGFDVGNQGNATGNATSDVTTTGAIQEGDNATTPAPLGGTTDASASSLMATAPSPAVMPNATAAMDATTNPTAELITPAGGNSSGMSAEAVNMTAAITSLNGTGGTSTTGNPQNNTDSTMNTTANAVATTSAALPVGPTSASLSNMELLNMMRTPVTNTGNNSNVSGARGAGQMRESNRSRMRNSAVNFSLLGVVETEEPTATNEENIVRKKRSIGHPRFSNYPGEGIWLDESSGWQEYNPSSPVDESIITEDMTDLQFLVNGCDPSTISTATYTAALPFAYLPSLRAFGVEFPLDDPRYNVILLVPSEGINSRILSRLLHGKTLRHIRQSMRPTWVRATIPSFMLRGFITLTPYLQKLGVIDAFEPRAADLSPMSADLGIYARDVQQSIGVNIRNYMRDGGNDTTTSTTSTTRSPYQQSENYLHTREPIPVTVDRPFLFFIVDNETSVALIAGRIDDPLNSRIH